MRVFQLWKDRSGNVAIVFALLLPMLMGGAGFAVDYAYFTMVKGELQGAADAAATAGAISLSSISSAQAAALDLAHRNVNKSVGIIATTSDVEFGYYNSATKTFKLASDDINAVRVTTGRTVARNNAPTAMFSAFLGFKHQEIHAVAIAVSVQLKRTCIHALNANAASAFLITGTSQLWLPTCGVQVNSNNPAAAKSEGSGSVTSEQFALAGGYSGAGFDPIPNHNAPLPDPHASIAEPTPPSCTYTNAAFSHSRTFPSGSHFCGVTKFAGPASFTFMPGIHYFTGTSLVFENSGDIIADGAMFYLGPNLNTKIAAQGRFQMSGMQSGVYDGIAVFQSRESTVRPTILIEGGTNFALDALLYAPKSKLEMGGNTGGKLSAGYIIADTVLFRGGAQIVLEQRDSRKILSYQSVLVR